MVFVRLVSIMVEVRVPRDRMEDMKYMKYTKAVTT